MDSATRDKMSLIIEALKQSEKPPQAVDDTQAAEFWARGVPSEPVVVTDGRTIIEGKEYIALYKIVEEQDRVRTNYQDRAYNAAYAKWYRRITRHANTLGTIFRRGTVGGRERLLLFVEMVAYQNLLETLSKKDFEAVYLEAKAQGQIAVSSITGIVNECVSFKDATRLLNLCGIDCSEMSLRTAYIQDRLAGVKHGKQVYISIDDMGKVNGLRSYSKKFVPRIR